MKRLVLSALLGSFVRRGDGSIDLQRYVHGRFALPACTHNVSDAKTKEDIELLEQICTGYLRGLTDALFVMQSLADVGQKTCMPKDQAIGVAEAREVFETFLRGYRKPSPIQRAWSLRCRWSPPRSVHNQTGWWRRGWVPEPCPEPPSALLPEVGSWITRRRGIASYALDASVAALVALLRRSGVGLDHTAMSMDETKAVLSIAKTGIGNVR